MNILNVETGGEYNSNFADKLSDWNKNVVEALIKNNDLDDLDKAALHIARILDFPNLDINKYLVIIQNMGKELADIIKKKNLSRPTQIIEQINEYLFKEKKFHPNVEDYNNPVNNYLNVVLDKKIGIPITLSILYISISKYFNFKLYPINFPGHFLIKYIIEDKNQIIIDPFNYGRIMDDYSLKSLLEKSNNFQKDTIPLTNDLVKTTTVTNIIIRILNNLKESYYESNDFSKLFLANEMILNIDQTYPQAIRDKGIMMINDFPEEARKMLEKYLEIDPEANDADQILDIIQKIRVQDQRK